MGAYSTILTSSLLAAVISAGVSALLSIILKNKDYRNDYYKKIIDKRIKAVELVEAMLSLFASVATIVTDEGRETYIYNFFSINHKSYDNSKLSEEEVFAKATNNLAGQGVWLSLRSDKLVHEFIRKVGEIRYEVSKIPDVLEVFHYYSNTHGSLASIKISLENSLLNDMKDLHDIEAFFRNRVRVE